MLIIEENSVYEIDEDCVRKKKVPPECKTAEKLRQETLKNNTKKQRGTHFMSNS